MAKISITEAARRANVERSTLYRRKRKGEISLEKGPDGVWCIDMSELLRAYPDAVQGPLEAADGSAAQGRRGPAPNQMHQDAESRVLQRELELVRQQLDQTRADAAETVRRLETDKTDLRERLDRADAERSRLLGVIEEQATQFKLLTDQRTPPAPAPTPAAAPPPAGGFLSGLRRLVAGRAGSRSG